MVGWATEIFGNSLLEYVIFLGVLAAGTLIGMMFSWIIKNVIKGFAHKTTTKIDDVLVEVFDGPVIFAAFVATFWWGRRYLELTPMGHAIYSNVLAVLFIAMMAWFAIRFLDSVIYHYVTPYAAKSKSDLDDVLVPIMQTVVKIIIICIAAIMILSHFGFNVTGLVAGLGIGGIAIALAAKDILGNMFGGVSIIADKPFKIGDMIKFDGRQGIVKQIGIRTTRVETLEGTQLIVPNEKFTVGVVENITNRQRHRVSIILGLQYDTDTRKLKAAREILKKLVKQNKKTADECTTYLSNFNSSSVDLQLIYFVTDLENIPDAQDEINTAIKEEFEKAGIEFAYPTQVVHIRQ